jgi:hypothetical protein
MDSAATHAQWLRPASWGEIYSSAGKKTPLATQRAGQTIRGAIQTTTGDMVDLGLAGKAVSITGVVRAP